MHVKTLQEYAGLLQEVGALIHQYRIAHDGLVPPEIFEAIFPIVGQYESFGAIVLVRGKGFAFVKRDTSMGAHWRDKYQLPCMAVCPNENDEQLLHRLARTEFGLDIEAWKKLEATIIPGRTVQWESERDARCRTRRCLLEVDTLEGCKGEWKIVGEHELRAYVANYEAHKATEYEFIDHMVAACLWYLDPEREKSPHADVDLRKYIPQMFDPYPL